MNNTTSMRTHHDAISKILFLDIETVSCVGSYDLLSTAYQQLWDKKATSLGKSETQSIQDFFLERAAIYAEFGKIIVIGCGYISFEQASEIPTLRITAFSGDDEKTVLTQFKDLLEKIVQQDKWRLCAHNGKEFDFSYLCRRMLVNGISLPPILDLTNKKPWEVPHLDTMEMWKFGDRKSFTSLDLLANLFNIPSSKGMMDGSQVTHYYYTQNALPAIAQYCMQDVVVAAQIFLKLNNCSTIPETNIIFA